VAIGVFPHATIDGYIVLKGWITYMVACRHFDLDIFTYKINGWQDSILPGLFVHKSYLLLSNWQCEISWSECSTEFWERQRTGHARSRFYWRSSHGCGWVLTRGDASVPTPPFSTPAPTEPYGTIRDHTGPYGTRNAGAGVWWIPVFK
jgi:hypothetical protein